ncbi:MAG: TerB family tellurite resistance protein [Bacteroidales bacterium]|nr:TerB family tellurite resistance protein [Bacteroidales bacterium]
MGFFQKTKKLSTEELSFSKQEITSIIRIAVAMCAADGEAHPNEMKMISNEALRFGVSANDFKVLLNKASDMKGDMALANIALMNDAQKRYVCAYLGTLMAIDGDIDDREKALWSLVSTLCELPTMSIADAIKYMAN